MNVEEQILELNKIIAGCEKEHQDFKRRLDVLEDELHELRNIYITLEKQGNALERMGKSLDRVERKVDNVDDRVEALEKEPGEKWKKTTWKVFEYVLVALLGILVGAIVKSIVP